jgi:long-chain acyl-CoA synthetase
MPNKPWLKFYEPHVPEHIEYLPRTMPQLLQTTADERAYRTAMIFKGHRISYGEFNRLVNQFAAALQQLGVKPGDRVAVHLPNCPQYPITYYAILRVGGIVVPCNPLYQSHEMLHQLNDSGAEIIITLSSLYPLIKSIRSETPLRHVIVAQIKTYFPPMLRLLFTLLREAKTGHRVDIPAMRRPPGSPMLQAAPCPPQPVRTPEIRLS